MSADLLARAERAAKAKDYATAKNLCDEYMASVQRDAKALRLRAFISSLERDYSAAVTWIDSAIAATGGNPEPNDFFSKGRWLLEQQRYTEAVSCFTEVLTLCGKYNDRYYHDAGAFHRALAYARMGEGELAKRDLASVADADCRSFVQGRPISKRDIQALIDSR